jgi:hypothetical protein
LVRLTLECLQSLDNLQKIPPSEARRTYLGCRDPSSFRDYLQCTLPAYPQFPAGFQEIVPVLLRDRIVVTIRIVCVNGIQPAGVIAAVLRSSYVYRLSLV